MTKSQFNIKISKDLLIRVKRQAMMSGKSLTEHITDLVTRSLSDNEVSNTGLTSVEKIKDLVTKSVICSVRLLPDIIACLLTLINKSFEIFILN